MRKYILGLVALLLAFALGMLVYANLQSSKDQLRQQDASVLLERVREVCKLVTVEGDLSEIYNETMTRQMTLYLPLPTKFDFDKKATLQVEGKVLVGYDLEQVDLQLDVEEQKLYVSNLPEPTVLAVDHKIKYQHLEESWFNGFTPKDYTALNESAKQFLGEKAAESDLIEKARDQGNSLLETIRFMVEGAGIELVVRDAPAKTTAEGSLEGH